MVLCMGKVLVAAGVNREMATDVTYDHGLAGTRRLGYVDAGRFATGAGATSDVRRDEILYPFMDDQVVLTETLQSHVGRVRAIVVGAVLSQEVSPGHTEARPRDIALGRERQGHQCVVDIVRIVVIRDSGAAKSAVSDDQIRTRISGSGTNRIKYGHEATRPYHREGRALGATTNRSDGSRTKRGQRARETTRDNRTLDDLDAMRNDVLGGEELAHGLLNPTAGLGAGHEEVAGLDVKGTTAVAKLSFADGGEANFTVEAEVCEDSGFDVPFVRPGLQLGRQGCGVFNGVLHNLKHQNKMN